MRPFVRSLSSLLVVLAFAIPMSAAIGPEVTLPAAGFLTLPNNLNYRTELVLTNHRNVAQYVAISFIRDGHDQARTIFQIGPRETKYLPSAGFPNPSSGMTNQVGALRVRALGALNEDDPQASASDPNGQIEATAYIVADRGRFAQHGSTRQEVHGIPASEYHAEELVFLGVRHSLGNAVYTNVGVVNLHPTETQTFYVQFQYANPVTVVVPPLSLRQIRLPGEGSAGSYVQVYPEWSMTGDPATPWVAYTSTIDMQTGDAFSGIRVPSTTQYDRLD